jgi:CspA family cold shock protein
MNGIVRILTDKGFGFITADGLEKDLFFHSDSLVGLLFDELRAGDSVHFDTEESPKGLNAISVRRNGGTRQDELRVDNTFDAIPPDDTAGLVAIQSIKAVTDELILRLNKSPLDLYQLHPKVFEELVAEIFMSEGFTTEMIKSWNQADGGIDIIAVRRDIGGFPVRYAIQCKRYAAHRTMTADPIRALAGVLDRFHAHVGVVATTSYFTKPAREEVEAHFWRINLRDYRSIVAGLQRLALLHK